MPESSKILSLLSDRIHLVRHKQNRVDLTSSSLAFLTGVIFISSFMIIAEMIFDFPAAVRTIIILLCGFLFFSFGSWMIIRPLMKMVGIVSSGTEEEIAGRIGGYFPSIKDRLLNTYQLAKNNESVSLLYSNELIEKTYEDFAGEIRPLEFRDAVSTGQFPTLLRRLIAGVILFVLLFLSFPESVSRAAFRMAHFTREFVPPAKYQLELFPGDKEIVKGENVQVRVTVKSLVPEFTSRSKEISIFRQQQGQDNFDETRLIADSDGVFSTIFHEVRSTTKYFAQFADVESKHCTLVVMDRPLIRSFRVRLDYPAYSKIQPQLMDEFIGDVTALAGTRITVSGAASKAIKDGFIQFGNNTRIVLSTKQEKFFASFLLNSDNSYYINITDNDGLSNLEPVHYQLKLINDELPFVEIIEPGRNIDIAGDQSLPLFLRAKDDFGFSGLRLGYRLIKSRYEKPHTEYTYTNIPLPVGSEGQMEMYYNWNLTPLNLVPEDVIEYFAEVFDNDAIHGPKNGRSRLFLLRLPSLDEVFADLDKEHERSIDDLKQSLDDTKKLKENIESINRDLKKNKDPDWQMQKKTEEIVKQYQDVQKKLEDIQSRIDQMTQQMQGQNVLSKETMEKYMELQQAFQQLDATELQKVLKQLQQQMPNISKDQLQQAMKNLTFSEDQFRQSIERTLSLLKRIQIEQKMDEVKKRAQELEKSERELKEENIGQSENGPRRQESIKKQADLSKKEQAMENNAEDLRRKMEEFFTEMPSDKMQKLLEQLKSQHLDQKMQQASQQMQMGEMQQAQVSQQQIEEHLKQFGSQIDAMQQQMLQQQSQFVKNEMRKTVNDLLELSKDEETLKNLTLQVSNNSPQLRENAQNQQQIARDLDNITKKLSELSQKSFAVTPEIGRAIGEASAHMNNSMMMLDFRNGENASREQEKAMAALNNAAMQVQNSLQSMMRGGSGGGMASLMQQLRMIAEKQMSVNMETQQAGEASRLEAAKAAKLAQQQAAIQKTLEELNREAQQGGGKKNILGDLQKISEEMKEVVTNLEQNNINSETIKRQERILSRLLDATKSTRERDFEKKRKSETGTQITRRSPNELDWETMERANRLREEISKAMEQGYSKDYLELIKKYFEELEKTEKSVY